MERWDLYDAEGKKTGLSHLRGEALPEGYYHLIANAWIRNAEGLYLLSKRSDDRPTYPGLWETVGGSALQGEDSLQAALRETREEIGLRLQPQLGQKVYSIQGRIIEGKKYPDILEAWLFPYDGPVNLQEASCHEVSEVAWMSPEEIRMLYQAGQMMPLLGYFFKTPALSSFSQKAH